jgi:hypothetical protein
LSQNLITDKSIIDHGFVELCESMICPPIRELILESNMITSIGAELMFNGLKNLDKIEHINLADNRITDEFVNWLNLYLKS